MAKESHNDKASLLSQWKNKKKSETASRKISKAPDGALIPLSHGQQRLWFLQQLYPDSPFYNYSEAYVFKGVLHVENLLKSLEKVCGDYEILRTTYHMQNGQTFMKIAPTAEIAITKHDFSNLSVKHAHEHAHKIMSSDAKHIFNLEKHPVVLASLIKICDTEHILMLSLHHISTDKWSMGILREELAKHYKSLCLNTGSATSEREVKYSDYTYWLHNQKVDAQQLNYWKDKLSGHIPLINLPTDFQRPARSGFKGKSGATQYFSEELSTAILSLSKELEVTPFILFLSVYYVLLFRYGGQKDILIGSPIASRDQKALENIIGFFNDTVVLRTQLLPDMSFKDLVATVKRTTLDAFSHKDVPFDLLVKELNLERSLAVNPFFQVMFLYHAVPETPSFGADLDFSHSFYDAEVSKFDLTLYISEEHGQLSATFEFSSELFEESTIERFQEYYKLLLEGVVEDVGQSILNIPMQTKKENEFFFSQKSLQSSYFSSFSGIHHIIESVCDSHPEKIAITYRNTNMTYGELNRRANIIALTLAKKAKNKNEVIGLCIERSLDMVVGLFAILKAGCAYLPLDPKYPSNRIGFMVKDAGVSIVVVQNAQIPIFENFNVDILSVDAIDTSVEIDATKLPIVEVNDLAYVIYTSGSTGQPKGVAITHKNIINSTEGRLDFYPENPECFLLLSSISFDSSKAGIFWTLCTGGNLIIAEDRIEQDIVKLQELINQNSVSHTLLLPSLYRLFIEYADRSKLNSLTTVIVAGEACPPMLCAAHFNAFSKVTLYNEYGPTEATVWSIAHKVEKEKATGIIPLGKPVANAQIYLLNESLSLVPFGAVGEIYIGGVGLSEHYINRPTLTDEAYVAHPFDEGSDKKLYRTGDLGRYNTDGIIMFLGRSDQQVKIRGYRIELNEIEKTIAENAKIQDVVVLVEIMGGQSSEEKISSGSSPKRLCAYLISDSTLDLDELKTSLKEKLPEYMIPASIVMVEAFPTLPNGKVDKTALQRIKKRKQFEDDAEVQLPSTALEFKLHEIWKEVLRIDSIGIHDNFFELGGDSILSIQFIAKARKAGIVLTPNQIFDYQTIAQLTNFISTNKKQIEEWGYLVTLRNEGYENPLFCIHAGGGHVFFYNILTQYIESHRPIYAVQASGVYADQAMHESIEEMAKDYIEVIRAKQPQGPYNIMVYCFSVAVGHEMVLQLIQQGQIGNLIVMDTMTDPWRLNTPKRFKMRIKGFVKRVTQKPFRTIKHLMDNRMLQARLSMTKISGSQAEKALVRVNENLAKICADYIWKTHEGKITLMLTKKPDESINKEVIDSWKIMALGGVDVIHTKGNHIDLFSEPDIGSVAKKIDENCI